MTALVLTITLALAAPVLAAGPSDQVGHNRDVIRLQYDLLNRGDLKAAVSYFAEDMKHQGRPVTRESRLRVLEDIYNTFPDWQMEVVDMVAADDSVVVLCKVSGTHRGIGQMTVNGSMLVGVPPTQKRFEAQHIHWYKLHDGKIVEHYAGRDDIGMMRQLGLLPPTGLPTAR
jgi:steroid delta-isomerase-like uncharacterized protein